VDSKIRLNIVSTHLFLKDGVKRVTILWDSERRKVAIAAAANDDPHGYKLSVTKEKNQAEVGVRSFAGFIGLRPKTSVKLFATYSGKMLEATVPEEAFGGDEGGAKKGGKTTSK